METVSILLEVKRNDGYNANQFYNPAPDRFKCFPRSKNGIEKAIKKLMKTLKSENWITDFQIVGYFGKYESYKKDMKPFIIIDSSGNVTMM